MLSPLIADQKDQPDDAIDEEDFQEEQTIMARFISLLQAEEPDQQYVVGVSTHPCVIMIIVELYSSFRFRGSVLAKINKNFCNWDSKPRSAVWSLI